MRGRRGTEPRCILIDSPDQAYSNDADDHDSAKAAKPNDSNS
jgi:hypothetical protein